MKFDRVRGAILGLMSFVFLACGDSEDPEKKINRLEAKVRKLEEKIDGIDSAFQDVGGAVLKLGLEIEDFSSENWRTNVPDVEYEYEQLKRATSVVEKKILR